MHAHAEIVFREAPVNLRAAVDDAMQAVDDADWWQIGGRWKGVHVDGYDASKDPDHLERCRYCNGTGKRMDMVVANGCNSCRGTGQAEKWPTEWRPHPLDFAATGSVSSKVQCQTLIIDGEDVGECDDVRAYLKERGITDVYLCTVDYHT